ncbi:hypothetical protein Purlil1_11388 [Purpureocillium lilacinum]|uniref:Uncharacterized protein n=1 Tax=Purpureocillium lilacinum TaxID=33203 RepID=A0ABR0BJP3_PURLI|nr:hypothetical protein Purlil1_11388 [Purpureocillium lilacinum]
MRPRPIRVSPFASAPTEANGQTDTSDGECHAIHQPSTTRDPPRRSHTRYRDTRLHLRRASLALSTEGKANRTRSSTIVDAARRVLTQSKGTLSTPPSPEPAQDPYPSSLAPLDSRSRLDGVRRQHSKETARREQRGLAAQAGAQPAADLAQCCPSPGGPSNPDESDVDPSSRPSRPAELQTRPLAPGDGHPDVVALATKSSFPNPASAAVASLHFRPVVHGRNLVVLTPDQPARLWSPLPPLAWASIPPPRAR